MQLMSMDLTTSCQTFPTARSNHMVTRITLMHSLWVQRKVAAQCRYLSKTMLPVAVSEPLDCLVEENTCATRCCSRLQRLRVARGN
mmetsp:Transcript_37309/g.59799  ORF Transcript_37309/g.59799 Transcript_37309/m.59799 type:complete len:86 (-) Transcript_37309:93-350(-)